MRTRSLHTCGECGYRTGKWLGRCPECKAWGAFTERTVEERAGVVAVPECLPLPDVDTAETARTSTGSDELDRVLGGGLVPGAAILVGGEPGVGKSTLLLQVAAAIAELGPTVVYLSGEESPAQLRARSERLGIRAPRLLVLSETLVESALSAVAREKPTLLVVDSIQAMRSESAEGFPGSVSQVRESASRLVSHAKATGTATLLVGHMTKDGSLAGPRTLEHLVDAVLQFEGDPNHEHRILRAIKNRFGRCHELGVFAMTGSGMRDVPDPSALLLSRRTNELPGSAVLASIEGSRPLLVEVQGLVGEVGPANPRRTALGIDSGRVAMILAILQRSTGLRLSGRDVFVNVTGGLTLHEPAADLAVAFAVASSALGRPLPARTVLAGELGLTGEIRAVPRLGDRLREAERLGMTRAIVPAAGDPIRSDGKLSAQTVSLVSDAFRAAFGDQIG